MDTGRTDDELGTLGDHAGRERIQIGPARRIGLDRENAGGPAHARENSRRTDPCADVHHGGAGTQQRAVHALGIQLPSVGENPPPPMIPHEECCVTHPDSHPSGPPRDGLHGARARRPCRRELPPQLLHQVAADLAQQVPQQRTGPAFRARVSNRRAMPASISPHV